MLTGGYFSTADSEQTQFVAIRSLNLFAMCASRYAGSGVRHQEEEQLESDSCGGMILLLSHTMKATWSTAGFMRSLRRERERVKRVCFSL